jgi:hypothetical protein
MRQRKKITLCLRRLHTWVLADDTGAGAGRVEEDTVKAAKNAGKGIFRVEVADDGVLAAEAVDVADQAFGTLTIRVVGKDAACVAHQGRYVSGFAAGSGGHVEDAFTGLWGECHDGEE